MTPAKRTLSYPYLGDPAKPHSSPYSNAMATLRDTYHGRIFNEGDDDTDTLTIPDTPEAFAEALADDEWRVKAFADGELSKEVLNAYKKMVNKGDAIAKQTAEQTSAALITMLKDYGITDLPSKAEVAKLVPEALANGKDVSVLYNPHAPGARGDHIDVNSVGHFAQLVIMGQVPSMSLNDDEAKLFDQLRQVQAQYASDDPGAAGFLIPETLRAEILQLALEQSVVRSRATVITLSSKTLDIPYVDVTTHSGSLFGGMIFFWTEESGAVQTNEAKFGRVRLEANKLTGGARIPNELLSDAPALGSWLNVAVPQGLAHYEDQAFLTGSGVGEPLGIVGSDAEIAVTRDTASQVNSADIFAMYARMLPQSLGSAVWVINQTVLPQLLSLTIDVGTGGSAIGLIQQIGDSPFMSLLGRPIVITEKVSALGTLSDVNFIDFSYYLIGDRQAVSMDTSIHSRFMNDEVELRIIERVDGRPWIQSALTPLNGDTISPVVALAT